MNDKFGPTSHYRENREPFWRGSEGDRAPGGFRGRGPKGYLRTDDRIREDVCERLSWDEEIDATEIDVRVENGAVILEGSVETRLMKRLAEDLAERVPGVTDVHNAIRVEKAALEAKREAGGATSPRPAERSARAR